MPCTGTFATVHFLYERAVSYAALTGGAEFELLEDLGVVGHGALPDARAGRVRHSRAQPNKEGMALAPGAYRIGFVRRLITRR